MFLLKKGEAVGESFQPTTRKRIPVIIEDSDSDSDTKTSSNESASSFASILNVKINPKLKKDSTTVESVIPNITQQLISRKPGDKYRVMVCGTYPIGQSNGYSRVVYYICKYIGRKEDIQLTIYGFQNYNQTKGHQRNDIPEGVILHDALAKEDPRRNGFGEKEIADYLKTHPQDLVMIFNDPVITSSLVQNIVENMSVMERRQFKLVSYMDQVYPYQRKQYIDLLNTYFDGIIAFTPYWRDTARSLGIKPEIPIYFFPHGFDSETYYPIPSMICRIYHQLSMDAFLILNLNRNQPRKRWDHTMMALADVIERHQKLKKDPSKAKHVRPIQLVVGTQAQGFWDTIEILENELRRRDLPKDLVGEYIFVLPNAQQLTDRDINVLYNACDIGLNTCEGEGFGLCQFEHLALMGPQVAPNIGGFKEFLNAQNSILVEPKWNYYIDKQRDGIGGLAEVGDPKDYADGIWRYYQNPSMLKRHGRKGRDEILQHYRWESMVDVFYDVLKLLEKGQKIATQ
jgi:glycosyltransferase involved in cell wall biosynthesis